MTAAVLENLAVLAGAPGGIRALRQLVMDLAITGRLIPQQAADGSADAVLKATAAMRTARRTASAAGTKTNDPGSRAPLPVGWVRSTVGEVLVCRDGERIPVSQADREGRAKLYDYYGASGVIDKIDGFLFDKPLLLVGEDGANLINRSTPIAFIARGQYWVNNHAHVLDGVDEDVLRYMALYFNAIDLKPYVTGTAQPKLNQAKLNAIPVALPPLAEQRRIVAKVDELMALCDRLEARQQDAEAAHARLVQALLDSLTQARDAEEFQACWERVADEFGSIFSTDSSIDCLKKSVLLLGVSGRLVSCGQRTVEASERSSTKPLWSTTHDWTWRTLGEVIESGIQNGISPKAAGMETPVRCLTLSATTRGKFDASCFKHVDLDNEIAEKYWLQPGDLLVQRANSIDYVGVSAIYDGQAGAFIFPDLMMRMRAGKLVAVEFLHLCLSVEPSRAYMRANATGTQGNMPKVNQGTVSGIPVPVPPLETQRRIVAKVTELIALCDQLKTRIAAARAKHAQLAEALVAQAVAA